MISGASPDAGPPYLRETADGCTLAVRVQPGARRTQVAGIYGEGSQAQLKIALQAPPVEGRANEALILFLAELCGVPKTGVAIVSGASARSKVCLIRGVSSLPLRESLGKLAKI